MYKGIVMENIVAIIFIIINLFFIVQAFRSVWNSFNGEKIGLFGWICIFIGMTGALLAVLIKGVMKLFKIPKDIISKRAYRIYAQEQEQEKQQREKQEEERQREYQKSLLEKRESIYPNSPYTKEIIEIITRNNELPYAIEINNQGLTFYFENDKKSYVFAAHELPDMDQSEEKIFADVLNQKLNNKYTIEEVTKYHSFTHSDGTLDGFSIHVATKMKRKVTKTF